MIKITLVKKAKRLKDSQKLAKLGLKKLHSSINVEGKQLGLVKSYLHLVELKEVR